MERSRLLWPLSLFLVLAACAGPPKSKIDTLYQSLNENLPKLDTHILAGRRVLIDPGHGGHFAGTRGQGGLRESEVNLGVSLYLWGLLTEAGADAFLTRSAAKDFLSETDSSLVIDLAARVALVDSLQPDIFVSVHHNAQPARDPTANATETYYRFGDPASRDLAFAIHRHMMRNLGVEVGEVRPGNYYILRNIDVPGVLGEGSYLTHPGTEKKLELSSKQRLEAEAYFLGILDYFSRGTPTIERIEPKDSVVTEVPTAVFSVGDIGGLGIDPGGVELTVNGRTARGLLDREGKTIRYEFPWDSPNGPYEIGVVARNLLGNTSPVKRYTFRIEHPPEFAVFDTHPKTLPAVGGAIRVRARLLDRRGLAIADSTRVLVHALAGGAPTEAIVDQGFVEFPVTVAPRVSRTTVALSVGGKTFELRITAAEPPGQSLQRIVFADPTTRLPIRNAIVSYGDSIIASGSHSGTYLLPTDPRDPLISVYAPGYRFAADTTGRARSDTMWMHPWYNGIIHGRRFVIDPEGGFGTEYGAGQLGLSGPYVNLQVAKYLREYLRAAGAKVTLTRDTEETLSPRDVVAVTNRFRADRYVEIRHRNAPADSGLMVWTSHYPGSATGRDMAEKVQVAVTKYLGLPVRPPREEVTFPLQQTACPAIVVELPSIGFIEEELRLGEPWYQRQQAYSVFLGILDHFGAPVGYALTVVVDADSLSSNRLVTLDGAWSLLSSPEGEARFCALPAGSYPVVLRLTDGVAVETVDLPGLRPDAEEITIRISPRRAP